MPRVNFSKEMLADKDVERWYRNVARGAEVTADTYLRRLRVFCAWSKKTPMEIARMDEKEVYELILDYISEEEKKGRTGSAIESSVKTMKSWLSHNGIRMARKIKIRGTNRTPSLDNERVPTQEELKAIFLNASLRDRVACVFMAHSGVRPEVLGNYRGNDGLRIKDIPELKINGETVEFEKIPTMVIIRPELSKTGLKYFSFLSPEGCDYLKAYLEERLRKGEKLDPDTDVLTPSWAKKSFIRSLNISDAIRKSIRAAGFTWRPYVLRAYADTQLMVGESKGKIIHSYRQFLMGHKGDIEARYTVNKNRLPETLIEDMRTAYQNSLPYLQTVNVQDEEENSIKFAKMLLLYSGIPKDEIDKLDIASMTEGEISDRIRMHNMDQMAVNGQRQRVVSQKEIKKYLEKGWEFVSSLPDGQIIIKLPT
jgi:integrase